jgi:SAM-dependent methyltransferase
MKTRYPNSFFKSLIDASRESADVVVDLVKRLIAPSSIIDVGCGTGTWLEAWVARGVNDVLGIDGDYVSRSMLRIPVDRFRPHDLVEPVSLERTFDLAMSLEVAEHLPEKSAPGFVAMLTKLAPVVLFSAAIPYQGGTHHINEQWPSYWATLFDQVNYGAVDAIREPIWDRSDVAYYYAQNILLFVDRTAYPNYPALQQHALISPEAVRSLVHPRLWEITKDPRQQSLHRVLRTAPYALRNALVNGLCRLRRT